MRPSQLALIAASLPVFAKMIYYGPLMDDHDRYRRYKVTMSMLFVIQGFISEKTAIKHKRFALFWFALGDVVITIKGKYWLVFFVAAGIAFQFGHIFMSLSFPKTNFRKQFIYTVAISMVEPLLLFLNRSIFLLAVSSMYLYYCVKVFVSAIMTDQRPWIKLGAFMFMVSDMILAIFTFT